MQSVFCAIYFFFSILVSYLNIASCYVASNTYIISDNEHEYLPPPHLHCKNCYRSHTFFSQTYTIDLMFGLEEQIMIKVRRNNDYDDICRNESSLIVYNLLIMRILFLFQECKVG